MTISSKDMGTQGLGYADVVRQAEGVYGESLCEDLFNLGAELDKKHRKSKFLFCAKTWAAWMRKASIKRVKDNMVVSVEGAGYWWLERIFTEFHGALAKHFNTQIWYYHSGKYYDLANYQTKKEKTPEQIVYAEACFREAREGIQKMLDRGNALKGEGLA